MDRVENDERDELFREVIGSVIVGAVRNQGGEAIGARPGRDQMVGRGLRGRIRRARIIGRRLDEQALRAERAVDLVGRHVQEAEPLALGAGQREPIGPRRLQHRKGSGDVRLDERVAAGDRAVDVALRREMDHMIRLKRLERFRDRASVADVVFGEAVVRRIVDRCERSEIACIGESVDVEHVDASADQPPAHG